MTTVALVWLVVGLLSTALLLVVVVALVRQGLLVGRTVARFARETGPSTSAITDAGRERGARR